MTDPGLSSTDICEATGITYRQLDYWYRSGAITPTTIGTGSGNPHRWSDLDAACLLAIAEVTHDLTAIGLTTTDNSSFIARLWKRLRTQPDIVICHGTLTISLSRPLVGGR